MRKTRPISWVKGALKKFDKFPMQAQLECATALTLAAEGGRADIVKPLHGFGPGVLEIALPYRGDVYRVVYALQMEMRSGSFRHSRRNRRRESRHLSMRST